MDFEEIMAAVVHAFEIGGVAILVIGSLIGLVRAVLGARRTDWKSTYGALRRDVGRAILLGLEFLIIADIVMTITIDPTLESAAALGLIVLVRTFLSFSLEIELSGSLPWRRRSEPGAATPVDD